MPSHHATPKDLIEAARSTAVSAPATNCDRLDRPARLLGVLRAARGLHHDPDLVVRNLLHSLAVFLRSRPLSGSTARAGRPSRLPLGPRRQDGPLEPYGSEPAHRRDRPAQPRRVVGAGPHPLPECPVYHSETFFLPHEQIGSHRFGGDWYVGRHTRDGSLWVMLADVTGHGYYAYLLAASLPHLWSLCWVGDDPAQPAELLARLHRWLEDSLPEGVYVEATLARLRPDGGVVVAPGGGCRVVVRNAAGEVVLHKLRGGWLGFMSPSEHDQAAWALAEGDEMLLGTDGLFDQVDAAHSEPPLTESLRGPNAGRCLFGAMRRLLDQALRRVPQKDDITVVLLRRRPSTEY
jgi:hypothetical protein